MTHVLARIVLRPDAAEAGRRLFDDLAAATRGEPGCVSYRVFSQTDAPHVFQTVEEWADPAAADAHMRTPHVAAAFAAATPLLAEAPRIDRFDPVA